MSRDLYACSILLLCFGREESLDSDPILAVVYIFMVTIITRNKKIGFRKGTGFSHAEIYWIIINVIVQPDALKRKGYEHVSSLLTGDWGIGRPTISELVRTADVWIFF